MQNCGVEEFDDHMHSGTYGMVLARHGRDATPITANAIIRGHQKPIGPVFSDVHLRSKATLFDGNVELNRYTQYSIVKAELAKEGEMNLTSTSSLDF